MDGFRGSNSNFNIYELMGFFKSIIKKEYKSFLQRHDSGYLNFSKTYNDYGFDLKKKYLIDNLYGILKQENINSIYVNYGQNVINSVINFLFINLNHGFSFFFL